MHATGHEKELAQAVRALNHKPSAESAGPYVATTAKLAHLTSTALSGLEAYGKRCFLALPSPRRQMITVPPCVTLLREVPAIPELRSRARGGGEENAQSHPAAEQIALPQLHSSQCLASEMTMMSVSEFAAKTRIDLSLSTVNEVTF